MSAHFPRAILGCLALLLFLAPAHAQMQVARNNAILQQAHAIGLALFSYANDNNGAYPTGNSSTEVFQKLMDGGYITDPSIFFVPMPGKVAGKSTKLKPENVCFDITNGVDFKSSDLVPLLFLTGYGITYSPGASAEPATDDAKKRDGVVIFYKSNSTQYLKKNADGAVPNVVPKEFNDKAHQYIQLTPEGPAGLA